MTSNKTTKRALLASSISLLLCFTMLLGTTFAWFTDSVTSANNIIKSGNLDVTLHYADGTKIVPADNSAEWIDGSTTAIFNYNLWEPGYIDVKHIKIGNAGTLALKYQINIAAEGELSNLTDVIDVYFIDPAEQVVNRTDLSNANKVGTLTEVLGGMPGNTSGALEAGESDTVTIALKMQESAGNEYQGLTFGEFSVQVLAAQFNSEEDSFDSDYDKDATFDAEPLAATGAFKTTDFLQLTKDDNTKVTIIGNDFKISTKENSSFGVHLGENVSLDTAYQFEPTMSKEDGAASEYANWHADFVVYANKDVPDASIALAGYYTAWCQFNDYKWVALTNDGLTVKANEEIRLVDSMGGGSITVSYKEICEYGNDGIGFLCGAKALDPAKLKGTTLTVELRLYEATSSSRDSETKRYITVGTYNYTFK